MASINPISVPEKRLAVSIDASSTKLVLDNIAGWDGVDLTSGDFGTDLYVALRNTTGTALELFKVDPTTINVATTTGLTILLRGLKFTGDLTTEVTGNKLTWIKNETIVELGSNPPQLLQHMVRTIGSPLIKEVLRYETAVTPSDDRDIPTKKYVDDLAFGGSVSLNSIAVPGNAGETVAANQVVYLDDTDNEWKLAIGTTASTVEGVVLGIAKGAGVDGGLIDGGVHIVGNYSGLSGLTATNTVFVGDTAGLISETAGTTRRAIGKVVPGTTTDIYFDPYFENYLSASTVDALAGGGDLGTPSTTNKFITEEGVKLFGDFGSGTDGAVDLDGTNTYAFLSKSGSEYTMTRDIEVSSLIIASGSTLITAGYKIFVSGEISGEGIVKWGTPNNGSNGVGQNSGGGGAAASGNFPFKNLAGASGGAGGTDGNNGFSGSSPSSANPGIGVSGGSGGSGGRSFSGTPAGGGSSSVTGPQSDFGVLRWLTLSLLDINYSGITSNSGATVESDGGDNDFSSHTHSYIEIIKTLTGSTAGGGGGGGTGGDDVGGSGGKGGGGGASGGLIFIAAEKWSGTFTIESVGGNGGDGADGTSGGGGGGGGAGGVSVFIYAIKTWTGVYTLTGGTGGTAGASTENHTSPANGADGTTGVSYEYDINKLI